MASWLKVAEGLFEVVDRRAKLVANELTDEQSDSHPAASNEQEVQARRTKSKDKGQSQLSDTEPTKSNHSEQEQSSIQISSSNLVTDKDESTSSENLVDATTSSTAGTNSETPPETTKDTAIPSDTSLEMPQNGASEHDTINDNVIEVSITEDGTEAATSSSNEDVTVEGAIDGLQRSSSMQFMAQSENIIRDNSADVNAEGKSEDTNASSNVDEEKYESEKVETKNTSTVQHNNLDVVPENSPNLKKQQEQKSNVSPMKLQDQLDEAQGLLRSASSAGQSKEARLARVCAGLSSRLQEYKSENAQLEELLVAERELSNSNEARIKQLQQDLSIAKAELARVESSMSDALAAKNSEIEALVSSRDDLKKQASVSEGKLASLQANMEAIMRGRELTETRMMQALREEISSAERRAEEERAAHNATKMAAVEREVELEHRAVEASNALARTQRMADESTLRATELEHKLALLEVECASLSQELQEVEARARRGQKKSSEEANQILQMQAWQEEAERARQGQRDAESKISSLEAEVQKMRVEMAGMRRDAEHYSRQEHMELEKRYRELNDLLYHKQTQLEAMASEKAAAEFQLEKGAKRLQEAQVEAERTRVSRRASATWEDDTDLKALEPLPLHHRHMAGASIQLQRAAKLLDTGAVRATKFLWRYPIARVILLFYLVFVHLFLMYLLHRLQKQADDFSSKEVAASMGLGNTLP